MARSRRSVLGPAPIRQPYLLMNHMPWDEIEAYVGRTFDRNERAEIYSCMSVYYQHHVAAKNAPPVDSVRKLRASIIGHAQGLREIKERFDPKVGYHPDDEEMALLYALSMSTTVENFDLLASLRSVALSCEQLLTGLSEETMEYEETQQDPEVIGLAHYVAEVVSEAQEKPARSNPGYKPPTAFEYHRWGLHVSPNSNDFLSFSELVLTRKITSGQLEHAFDVARDQQLVDRGE